MKIQFLQRVALAVALVATLLPVMPAMARSEAERGARPGSEPLRVFVYTFEHQSAVEALTLVEPLLSQRGTIELKKADNTLVIRDELRVMRLVAQRVREFDHPRREIALEILLVRARRASYSPTIVYDDLPKDLATKLRKVMPYYTSHELVADTDVHSFEGEEVTYEIGGGYRVSYRMGTAMGGQVKLHNLRVARLGGERSSHLMEARLPLNLDRPLALTLAKSEESKSALMLILTPTVVHEAEENR